MVTIQLDEDYQLQSDTHSWALAKRTKKAGKVKWRQFKWFPSPQHVVEAYIELRVKEVPASTLDDLRLSYERFTSQVRDMYRELEKIDWVKQGKASGGTEQ